MTPTELFMSIVDCQPQEVLCAPADRLAADPLYVPATAKRSSLDSYTMYIGKYKGMSLAEIPREYLEWFARQPKLRGVKRKTRSGMERIKRKVREFLRNVRCPA